MKKKVTAIIIIIVIAGLTGCVQTTELDKEQELQFIEYSVYSVLEHDKNYMIGLNQVEIESEPETESDATDNQQQEPETDGQGQSNQNQGGTTVQATDNINDALGVEGATVKYAGVSVCDSFPEAENIPSFVIKAVSGKKLVVLKFDITNTTDSDMKVDLSSKKLSFKGIFNGSVKTNVLVTLLPEAMNTFDDVIPAGGTIQTVLVFEISESYADNITTVTVEVKSESGTKSIKLK